MKIAYHQPSLATIYAQRTIYNGFKNAFVDMGHEFVTFTADDDFVNFFELEKPDIFITASHFYYRKFIDYAKLLELRRQGLVVFTKLDFWQSPIAKSRINEAVSMKDDHKLRSLLSSGLLGDIFFHVVEQDDDRMAGFFEETGFKYETIPLAADRIALEPLVKDSFKSQLSFVGTYLPDKRHFFKEWLFPLKEKYQLKIYGQDWGLLDRLAGFLQKVGQYFNLPGLRSLKKPKLSLADEAAIYHSSDISLNIHESYQRFFGGDCNERTFKIPLCGGFEISDDVACLGRYFEVGKELIVAKSREEWFNLIEYYSSRPEERRKIVEAGRERVLKEHTYHHRAQSIIELYENFKTAS